MWSTKNAHSHNRILLKKSQTTQIHATNYRNFREFFLASAPMASQMLLFFFFFVFVFNKKRLFRLFEPLDFFSDKICCAIGQMKEFYALLFRFQPL